MPKVSITQKWIAAVQPPPTGRETWTDTTLTGFAVVVTAKGKKCFYRIGRVGSSPTRTKLGDYPLLNVEAARRLCLAATVAAKEGKRPKDSRTPPERTLGDVWEWYWENCVNGVLKNAPRMQRDWLRLFAKPWGQLPLSEITRPMVIEFQAGQRRVGTGAETTSLALLKALFKTAAENGWITSTNPTIGLRKPHAESRDRFILPTEIETFFSRLATLDQDFRDLFAVALFTGARRANVMSMKWIDIDAANNIWTIPGEQSKNKSAMRLPLSTLVQQVLTSRLERCGHSQWVFPSKRKKDGHISEPKHAWKRLLEGSGLTNLRIHDLRRTLGSWQALAGVSLITIGKTLGQKSISATAVYARLQDQTVRESIQATTEALDKAGNRKKSENA